MDTILLVANQISSRFREQHGGLGLANGDVWAGGKRAVEPDEVKEVPSSTTAMALPGTPFDQRITFLRQIWPPR